MTRLLEATFPLVLDWDESCRITFALQGGRRMAFDDGLTYIAGDNGSGKTSFLALLSLTAGELGPRPGQDRGTVVFDGTAYDEPGFDAVRAADIRERHFGIFPQKVFFLPVSTRDNYRILNGRDPDRARRFSDREYPSLLSGGQQQERLMEIVLDESKPLWFLDEPLTHLDAERRLLFWRKLETAVRNGLRSVLMVDHRMAGAVRREPEFRHVHTLRATVETRGAARTGPEEFRTIDLYHTARPLPFVRRRIEEAQASAGASTASIIGRPGGGR